MEEIKQKFNIMKDKVAMNDNVFTLSIAVTVMVLIGAVCFYKYTEVKSIENNIQSAIVKGIDPVAVRCAYASGMDNICVSYAASTKK